MSQYDPQRNSFIDDFGNKLVGVHTLEDCKKPERCVIHNQSDHNMKHLPLLWRPDGFFFERVCEHGVGHPDPDDAAFQEINVHGCDGCCARMHALEIDGSYEVIE
jgi:hypothetical protein